VWEEAHARGPKWRKCSWRYEPYGPACSRSLAQVLGRAREILRTPHFTIRPRATIQAGTFVTFAGEALGTSG